MAAPSFGDAVAAAAITTGSTHEEKASPLSSRPDRDTLTPWGISWMQLLRDIQPTAAVTEQLRSVFQQISTILKPALQKKGYAVDGVEQVGSSGKGTNWSKHIELDVVFLLQLPTGAVAKGVEAETCAVLDETSHGDVLELMFQAAKAYNKFSFVCKQPRSIGLKCDGVDVDVLPAVNLPDGALSFLALNRNQVRSEPYGLGPTRFGK